MKQVERSALVPYSAEQMFSVVNDVKAYADFLPWCDQSEVLEENDAEMVARLSIARSGIRQSFTTRNRLNCPTGIDIRLIDGPFSRLQGSWRFDPLGHEGCKVIMRLSFGFDNKLINLAVSKVFETAADNMVDAFCARADSLYGNS